MALSFLSDQAEAAGGREKDHGAAAVSAATVDAAVAGVVAVADVMLVGTDALAAVVVGWGIKNLGSFRSLARPVARATPIPAAATIARPNVTQRSTGPLQRPLVLSTSTPLIVLTLLQAARLRLATAMMMILGARTCAPSPSFTFTSPNPEWATSLSVHGTYE